MDEVVLLTVSFRGDLERFRILRESVEATGTSLLHFVVVDTEDLGLFSEFSDANVTLVPSAAVLPPEIERRRSRRYRRRDPRYWTTRRRIPGWLAQQFIKLSAVAQLEARAAVVIDSDSFLLRPVNASDFTAADGRTYLYSSPIDDAMTAGWTLKSMDFLRIPHRDHSLRQYIHEPTVLDVQTTRMFLHYVEQLHRTAWWSAMESNGVYEYSTYGAYAENIPSPATVYPHSPVSTLKFWSTRDFINIGDYLAALMLDTSAKFGGVQSSLCIPTSAYSDALRTFWARE